MNPLAGIRQIFRGRSLTLLVLGLCEFARGGLLFFILPMYVRDVLLQPQILGDAMAVHYILDTGLRSPAGYWGDRLGRRRVVVAALMVGWLGLIAIILAQHAVLLVAGCGLLGIAMAAVWPAAVAQVTGGLSGDTQATAMGGVMMAWLGGVGAGVVLLGCLLGQATRAGAVVLWLVWTLALAMAAFAFDRVRPRVVSSFSSASRRASVWRHVRHVRWLFPGMFVQTFAMGLLLPVLVLYARDLLGLSPRWYSGLLILGGATTLALQLPFGRLVDRFGYRWFLTGGFALAALSLVALVKANTLWPVVVSVAGFGTGYALILPSWTSVLAHSVPPHRRGMMWGVFMTVEGFGMATGPIVGSHLYLVNPRAPLYGTACILLCMMVLYGLAPLHRVFEAARVDEPDQREREAL